MPSFPAPLCADTSSRCLLPGTRRADRTVRQKGPTRLVDALDPDAGMRLLANPARRIADMQAADAASALPIIGFAETPHWQPPGIHPGIRSAAHCWSAPPLVLDGAPARHGPEHRKLRLLVRREFVRMAQPASRSTGPDAHIAQCGSSRHPIIYHKLHSPESSAERWQSPAGLVACKRFGRRQLKNLHFIRTRPTASGQDEYITLPYDCTWIGHLANRCGIQLLASVAQFHTLIG